MSALFDVRSSLATYSVKIELGLLDSLLRQRSDDVLIADEWFAKRIADSGKRVISLRGDEASKSLASIPESIIALRNLGANRQTQLVAIGGGTLQDVTAFIASVYMRGLQWVYFPTTLLAMADSCIGGKSSINVGPYKNLVGTFHPPNSVFIDPSLILTLSEDKRVSGLIEAAKICYCRGEGAFTEYMTLSPAAKMSVAQAEEIIHCSLLAKKWFIEVDEFDKAERLLLNFGHTFGHAFEGASQFRIAHGVGVAIGMLCAISFGKKMGRNYSSSNRVHTLEHHLLALLSGIPDLLTEIADISIPDILDRFETDKKHGTDLFTLILVAESGAVELNRLPRDRDTRNSVRSAIGAAIGSLIALLSNK